jgi:nicotinamidase-related amidase
VLTGIAADICVLFTAADAHMREYELWTPSDGVASDNPEHARWALGIMHKSMGARVEASTQLSLFNWVRSAVSKNHP